MGLYCTHSVYIRNINQEMNWMQVELRFSSFSLNFFCPIFVKFFGVLSIHPLLKILKYGENFGKITKKHLFNFHSKNPKLVKYSFSLRIFYIFSSVYKVPALSSQNDSLFVFIYIISGNATKISTRHVNIFIANHSWLKMEKYLQ